MKTINQHYSHGGLIRPKSAVIATSFGGVLKTKTGRIVLRGCYDQ